MTEAEEIRAQLVPRGRLRVALNHGNRVLVSRTQDGSAQGTTPDLAALLAEQLGLEVEFVHFERAGDVIDAAGQGVYDLCFLAVDPDRTKELDFTAPYVQIERCYLAGSECDVPDAAALVERGLPVGTVRGSAYTLDLSRKPGAEHLTILPDIEEALAVLDSGRVSAIAGIGTVMAREAESRPGARVLDPPFMSIRQAMAVPRGRPEAANHIVAFVADLARAGRIGQILESHGVSADCAVIPSEGTA